jgi:hypothetical protein
MKYMKGTAAAVSIKTKTWLKQISVFGVLMVMPLLAEQTAAPAPTVKLNPGAFQYARDLIAARHAINDKRGSWFNDQPSAKEENKFVDEHSIEEYARWHLGFDESHAENSKARYKFPFGDFENVHRCALIAAQNRARQYGYRDIETSATELLQIIEAQSH